jgi:UDP-N-acetylglucosamine enolpyruvyl transferase
MAIVTIRYFGGTLLGTGGLVRAYSAAACGALNNAGIITYDLYTTLDLTVSYSDYQKITTLLSEEFRVKDTKYLDSVTVSGSICEAVNIETAPYPAFPSDLQPLMAPLLAASSGGVIKETVWKRRFGYLDELIKFGIDFSSMDGYAEIKHSKIKAASARAPDLRGGAALVLAALYADGESIIDNAELINRGYSDIINKLSAVGADIRYLN